MPRTHTPHCMPCRVSDAATAMATTPLAGPSAVHRRMRTVCSGACGVPVVTTRVGGVEDALVEGVTGASVPSDDAKLLARAVLMTLEELHWRARARREAPRFVRERFGAAGMIERTLALYGLPARARPGVPA